MPDLQKDIEKYQEAIDIIKELARKGIEARYPGTKGKVLAFVIVGHHGWRGFVGDAELVAKAALYKDSKELIKELTEELAGDFALDSAGTLLSLALEGAGITITELTANIAWGLLLVVHPTKIGVEPISPIHIDPKHLKPAVGIKPGIVPIHFPGGPKPGPKPGPEPPTGPGPKPPSLPKGPQPKPGPDDPGDPGDVFPLKPFPKPKPKPGPEGPEGPVGPGPHDPGVSPSPKPKPKPSPTPAPAPQPKTPDAPKPAPPKPKPAPPEPKDPKPKDPKPPAPKPPDPPKPPPPPPPKPPEPKPPKPKDPDPIPMPLGKGGLPKVPKSFGKFKPKKG